MWMGASEEESEEVDLSSLPGMISKASLDKLAPLGESTIHLGSTLGIRTRDQRTSTGMPPCGFPIRSTTSIHRPASGLRSSVLTVDPRGSGSSPTRNVRWSLSLAVPCGIGRAKCFRASSIYRLFRRLPTWFAFSGSWFGLGIGICALTATHQLSSCLRSLAATLA